MAQKSTSVIDWSRICVHDSSAFFAVARAHLFDVLAYLPVNIDQRAGVQMGWGVYAFMNFAPL